METCQSYVKGWGVGLRRHTQQVMTMDTLSAGKRLTEEGTVDLS